jgi:hypothetical protein
MESDLTVDIQIDQKVLVRIYNRILKMERDNLNTNKPPSSEITGNICKLIEFEVDKNDN